MINVDQEYSREIECEYKGERYKVRDNGAILRMAREGMPKRPKDEIWTFGETINRGYATFCGERVHIIVATAFHGERPTKQYVVDHIDTNRQNNRPENLRWLTRLENILLNPITKAKIEYWCGSVEEFLENPSQLNGHESDDANFAWMRAVSREEAENTLANWQNIISKPRTEFKSKGNPVEEWIFQQNHPKREELDFLNEFKPEAKTVSNVNQETELSLPSKSVVTEKNKTKEKSITKTEFINAFLDICENEGFKYEKRYKTDKWTADILVTTENERFAFSVYKSVAEASEFLPLMEQDGVKGFGLILSPKKDAVYNIACFGLHRKENAIEVCMGKQKISLDSFVKYALEDKIEHITKAKITAIDVIFEQIDCWHCHEPHYVPYVRYWIDENGMRVDDEDDYNNEYERDYSNVPDLRFGDEFLEVVRNYIAEHPEKGIVMGEVKERYSKTRNESYMSYGCPKCDAIVGDWYLKDLEIDLMYETNESRMNRILLKTPFEIPVNEWIVKE